MNDLDDVGARAAEFAAERARRRTALDTGMYLVALDDRRYEGGLLRWLGQGPELRGGGERGEHGEPEGGTGRFYDRT
jgi:hypothetical protein